MAKTKGIDFRSIIETKRKEKGLSVEALASGICSHMNLVNFLSGRNEGMNSRYLEKILDRLGVEIK